MSVFGELAAPPAEGPTEEARQRHRAALRPPGLPARMAVSPSSTVAPRRLLVSPGRGTPSLGDTWSSAGSVCTEASAFSGGALQRVGVGESDRAWGGSPNELKGVMEDNDDTEELESEPR